MNNKSGRREVFKSEGLGFGGFRRGLSFGDVGKSRFCSLRLKTFQVLFLKFFVFKIFGRGNPRQKQEIIMSTIIGKTRSEKRRCVEAFSGFGFC